MPSTSRQPRPSSAARLGGRIAFVLGTRAEITRLAPVVHELGDAAALVHTGQQHDPLLGTALLAEWGLAAPDAALDMDDDPSGDGRLERIMLWLDANFTEHRPAAVVVLGGSMSATAGALAANGAGIPVVHVGAGARSHDRHEPAERHRVVVDRLADVLCAVTPENVTQLIDEDYDPDRIVLTGSTAVEACSRRLPAPARGAALVDALGLDHDCYVLAALDTLATTERPELLSTALTALGDAHDGGCQVVLPLHPRTRSAVVRQGLEPLLDRLRVIDALDRRSLLALASHAAVVVTDSGAVQEEATLLGRPHLVVRETAELPESLGGFAEPTHPLELARAIRRHLAALPDTPAQLAETASPFGDGFASERIAEAALAAAAHGGGPPVFRRVIPRAAPDDTGRRQTTPSAVIDAIVSA
ncbi:UDP-N-acetylglucosamine 2-epimerase [Streptomyces sp. NBC_01465]|uniref:UDP-N-acetylglucosamine 2-epimerase n=1 Tax=Streptomyces sp. NBC_01465 TaxID=2903878 RepID=UPI002E373874|nr:UDP-N-acetylglucosamine 2-epimerase [Streptomyces sp. NBC_01465]